MEQLMNDFMELARYSVPSKHEGEIRADLKRRLENLGFETSQDECFPETGSGNLYGFLPGIGEPILFVAHMDTVSPCQKEQIIAEPDGTIHTNGTSVLGGDDLTGIVEFLSAVRQIQKHCLPHRPIEVVFTACEEYFVEGAKRLDYRRIRSKEAYVLDTDGEIGRAVLAAPTGIRILATVSGKASHAALKPEDGVNAISVAAEAISKMKLGRIDEDTTANIGIIQGGDSGNIIPEKCFVEGETRSLCHEKALCQRDHMVSCFEAAAEKVGGKCSVDTQIVYEAWAVEEKSHLCRRFGKAAQAAGLEPSFERSCGGSDASFLSAHGISCLVLATGMHEIHSVREYTTRGEMITMSQVVKHLMLAEDQP